MRYLINSDGIVPLLVYSQTFPNKISSPQKGKQPSFRIKRIPLTFLLPLSFLSPSMDIVV